MTAPHNPGIPECRLSEAAVGPQLSRYRQLAQHVVDIQRNVGEVRVQFDDALPDGLLGHTLSVERECCSFLGLAYDLTSRSLTITVDNIAQDPRLDLLAALLNPATSDSSPGVCDTSLQHP
jgi:hypothetical protein